MEIDTEKCIDEECIEEEYIKEECTEEECIDEEEFSSTSPKIVSPARNVNLNLLPQKSRKKYEKQYELFVSWCKTKKFEEYTENVMIAYFSDKAKTMKSSTLWSTYSMLRSVLSVKNNVDISQYKKLIAYLKRQSVGYKAKKSKTFTKEEVLKFLSEAPDEVYLLKKVVLIMGIFGACRRDQLVRMTINDIEDKDSVLIVKIPDTMTNQSRVFTVSNICGEFPDFLSFYRRYIALRSSDSDTPPRLFLRYFNGKCTKQVVGMNIIGNIPSDIARYLNLPDFKLYTGHSFRRTSFTFLANRGSDFRRLRHRDGWRSSTVAEDYAGGNTVHKVVNKVVGANKKTVQVQSVTYPKESEIAFPEHGILIKDCTNCTFHVNVVIK